MKTYAVETDDGRYGPAVVFHVRAENLLTAWLRAGWYAPAGTRVMVVFSTQGPYEEATRISYSSTYGTGDPHRDDSRPPAGEEEMWGFEATGQ